MELGVSDKGSTHRLMRDTRLFIKQLINKPCLSFTLDALRHVNSSPILHAYEGLFRPVAPTSNGRRRYCVKIIVPLLTVLSIVKEAIFLMPTDTLRKTMAYDRKITVCSSFSPQINLTIHAFTQQKSTKTCPMYGLTFNSCKIIQFKTVKPYQFISTSARAKGK